MRREEWKKEPAPLAYRVRPQPQECFDSWLDRLTAAHGIGRGDLLGHLGIERALGGVDLARGKGAIGRPLHGLFDDLVDRLAWAVEVDRQQITDTFVRSDARRLLPPAMRRHGCPACALEWCRAGRPIIILREWILRLAWRCHRHRVVLVDLRPAIQFDGGKQTRAWLERAAQAAGLCDAAMQYDDERVVLNRRAQQRVADRQPGGMSRLMRDYLQEFGDNQLHFVPERTLLLANAHCREQPLLGRYEAFTERLSLLRARTMPTPPPSEPVTLGGLASAIVEMHLGLSGRNRDRLISLTARLSAKPQGVNNAQVKLDRVYERLRLAWEWLGHLRAARDGHRALQTDSEWMRRRIALECREHQSRAGSLRYLQAALRYRQAAIGRAGAKRLPSPVARPAAWGLGVPGKLRLEGMIEERTRDLFGTRAAELGEPRG